MVEPMKSGLREGLPKIANFVKSNLQPDLHYVLILTI